MNSKILAGVIVRLCSYRLGHGGDACRGRSSHPARILSGPSEAWVTMHDVEAHYGSPLSVMRRWHSPYYRWDYAGFSSSSSATGSYTLSRPREHRN